MIFSLGTGVQPCALPISARSWSGRPIGLRSGEGGRGSPRPPSRLFRGFLRYQIADAAQLAEQRAAVLGLGGRSGVFGTVENQPHQLRPDLASLGALAYLGIGFAEFGCQADQLGIEIYGHVDRAFDRRFELLA